MWAEAKEEAWEAWGRCCALHGVFLPWEQMLGHHRLMRSAGGPDTAINCLPLCFTAHEAVHLGGDGSYDRGLLVRSWLDPADVPVRP